MKKAKKLMIATAFLFSVALTGAAIGSLNNVSSDAAAAEQALLSIDAGASIRVDTLKNEETGEVTGYDTGIRFTATASQTLVSSLVETTEGGVAYKDGAELGMFIVPQTYLAAYNAQKKDGIADYFDYFSQKKGLEKSQFTYVCSADELNATGDTNYNVSILKLYEQNYNRTYQAVAYYTQKTEDTVTYYYTDTSDARTVSYVADAALLDPDGNYGTEKRKALGGLIERALELKLGANGTGEEAEYFGAVHGDTPVKLQQSFTPEITASDLTFTVKSGAENLSITKGTATATAAGTATMNVSAYGGLVDFDVTMKTLEKQDNEVLDFAGANDMVYNTTNEGDVTGVEYVENYQGANGVLKVTAKNWGRVGFDPVQAMDAYAGYKYLVIRMWADTTATDAFVYIDETNVGTSMTTLKTGRWINYYFDAETFRTQWADLGNYFSSMAFNRAGTYYIDKIYVTNDMEVIDFAHATDIAAATGKDGATISYIDNYQGKNGVLQVNAGSWSCLKFTPINALADYGEYKYLVLRMNATVTSNMQIAATNGGQLSELVPNEWRDIYFDADAFRTQWADAGNYYSNLIFKTAGTFYIDTIYMTNDIQPMVLDFYNETLVGTSYVKNQWDTTPSYLGEYKGAQGVLKIEVLKNYGCLSFKNLVSLNLAKNFTYLVVRAWVDTDQTPGSGANTIRLGYGSGETVTPESGCWKEYKFDMAGFVDFWTNYDWTNYNASLVFGYASTWYIDCIYAI